MCMVSSVNVCGVHGEQCQCVVVMNKLERNKWKVKSEKWKVKSEKLWFYMIFMIFQDFGI